MELYPGEFTMTTGIDGDLEGSFTIDYKTDGDFNSPIRSMIFVDEQYYKRVSHDYTAIKKVIINPPATIVIWKDGHKEVVKCSKDEDFNPEVGVAMCFMKRIFGSRNQFTKLVDGAWNEYKKQFQRKLSKLRR